MAGLFLAVAWYTFLIATVAWTANPVTFNRYQLRNADVIVSGEYAHDQITVQQVWKGDCAEPVIKLIDSPELRRLTVGNYIVPLTRRGRLFEVTPTRAPDQPGLVYPLTKDSARDLEAVLSELRR